MRPISRRKLRKTVHKSYILVNKIIEGAFRKDTFVTSVWAVLEAIGRLKRSRIEFNMITDNTSLSYYDAFKDKRGYKLDSYQTHEIQLLVRRLERTRSLGWSDLGIEFQGVLKHIMRGLDPPDAVHVQVAVIEQCDVMVTRDKDFTDRTGELNRWFEVMHPATALARLQMKRRRRPPSLYDTDPHIKSMLRR